MKICVVVPSTEYLKQAGVRIRYSRLQPALVEAGHQLEFRTTEELCPDDSQFDAYLFSKSYDTGAILLAMEARRQGSLVGIDLFDDMFSHADDSRVVHYRRWAADIAPYVDFALCSTPRMVEVVADLLHDCPSHLMHDLWDDYDEHELGERIERKRQQALNDRKIDVAWFGVGDNPIFPVGLSDLFAFGGELRRLERTGFVVQLHILTNARALTEEGLRMIERLPVSHRVDIWSVEAEQALLDASIATFLPVNAQKFSIAKSLNRCISAITAGTQIFSSGHPLYAALDSFIYRDAAGLLDDLMLGSLRVRDETIPALRQALDGLGNPTVEAERLSRFLTSLRPGHAVPPAFHGVVNGRRSSPSARRVADRLDVLTIASPMGVAVAEDDVQIEGSTDSPFLFLTLTPRAVRSVAPAFREELVVKLDGSASLRLAVTPDDAFALFGGDNDSLPETAGFYDAAMRTTAEILRELFPGIALLLNEHEAALSASLDLDRLIP